MVAILIGNWFRKAADQTATEQQSSKSSKASRTGSGSKNGPSKTRQESSSERQPKNSQSQSAKGSSSSAKGASNRRRSRNRRPKPKQPEWSLDSFQVPAQEGKTRFHDLGLPDDVMHAIQDLGFQYCSPIQAQSLPHTLNGDDLVGKAQTGTGKTAAFLLSIIDDLIRHPIEQERYAGEARALIIAPTRELVIQIADDAKALCKYTDLKIHTLVGGMDYGKQQRKVQDELVDILVATPGRLLDFASNRDIYLDQVEVLVIDEADRMLDMGFIPQVRNIIRQTPKKSHRQTLLFSATFTDDVLNLAEQWTDQAVRIEIEPESVATDRVEQHIYLAATEEKYTLLYNILQQQDVENLIVFANRRDECRRLHENLERHGFAVGILSGDVPQNKRVKTLEGFKSGRLKVLVATDVAGRGIHIDGISHVVNFTLPEEPEDYVHRIGRTGRAGRSGTSISFACEDDALRLEPIQELLGNGVKCEQPPEVLLKSVPEMKPRAPRSSGNDRGGRPQGRNGNRSGRNNSHRRSSNR